MFAFAATLCAAAPTSIPVEDFFADSEIRSVSVAPDGKHIAWLSPVQGIISLMLFDLETGKADLLARPNDENITAFFWKGGELIVYSGELGGNEIRCALLLECGLRMRVDVVPDRLQLVVKVVNTADDAEQRLFDRAHMEDPVERRRGVL